MTEFISNKWAVSSTLSSTTFQQMADNDKKLHDEFKSIGKDISIIQYSTNLTINLPILNSPFIWPDATFPHQSRIGKLPNAMLTINLQGTGDEYVLMGLQVPSIRKVSLEPTIANTPVNDQLGFLFTHSSVSGRTVFPDDTLLGGTYLIWRALADRTHASGNFFSVSGKFLYRPPAIGYPWKLEIELSAFTGAITASGPANMQMFCDGQNGQFWAMHYGTV